MSIDWENILGDKKDTADVHDSLVFDVDERAQQQTEESEPEDFNGNVWYKDATGEEPTESYNEYVAALYVMVKYVDFLKENHNNLPRTALGKAFAFFMTDVGGRIMAADRNQANAVCKGSAEEVICDGEIGIASRIADLPKETTHIATGKNCEAAKIIRNVFCEYQRKHDYYDEALMAVYDFVEECGKKEANWDSINDNSDENMLFVFNILSETKYDDIDWDVFETWDKEAEKVLGKFR